MGNPGSAGRNEGPGRFSRGHNAREIEKLRDDGSNLLTKRNHLSGRTVGIELEDTGKRRPDSSGRGPVNLHHVGLSNAILRYFLFSCQVETVAATRANQPLPLDKQ
jgi:hypothetical protein